MFVVVFFSHPPRQFARATCNRGTWSSLLLLLLQLPSLLLFNRRFFSALSPSSLSPIALAVTLVGGDTLCLTPPAAAPVVAGVPTLAPRLLLLPPPMLLPSSEPEPTLTVERADDEDDDDDDDVTATDIAGAFTPPPAATVLLLPPLPLPIMSTAGGVSRPPLLLDTSDVEEETEGARARVRCDSSVRCESIAAAVTV